MECEQIKISNLAQPTFELNSVGGVLEIAENAVHGQIVGSGIIHAAAGDKFIFQSGNT